MSALDDLRDYLIMHAQHYREGESVTEGNAGGVHVTTINSYPHLDQAPASSAPVDLLLTWIGFTPDTPPADRETLRDLVVAACGEHGEFTDITLEAMSGGPSYIALGGWLGSQDLALRLIGLGQLVGLWKVMTGMTIGLSREQAIEMAGGGWVCPLPAPGWTEA